MNLAADMLALGITCRALAKATGMSKSAAHRLTTDGQWPARGTELWRQKVRAYLEQRRKEVGPDVLTHAEAVPPATPDLETESTEEDFMLLQNHALTPDARKHFGLSRSPFVDDVQSPDDVFQSPSVRYVRAVLMDCAMHHGFCAVVGESGAGKSTLAEDLEERIKAEGRDIMVIRPYVLAM